MRILRFLKEETGSFSTYFAVLVIVLVMGASVAIDANGMHTLRAKYQDMADAAVLAAAKSRPKEQGAMEVVAKSVIKELDTTGSPPTAKAVLSPDRKTVQVHLDGSYKSNLMKVFGHGTVDIKVMAESLIEVQEYTDIVLILDTTGSMSREGRLASLKTAATNFLNTIQDIDSDKVSVSVVPFGHYMNVGTSNRAAAWMDVPTDWWEPRPDVCTTDTPFLGYGPTVTRYTSGTPATPYVPAQPAVPPTYGTCTHDGVSYSCQKSAGSPARPARPATPATPGGQPYDYSPPLYGPPVTTCKPQPPIHHTWSGCVGSRFGTDNVKPSYTSGESKVPGYLDMTCSPAILPLTTNISTVKTKINGLSTNGETYTPSGLVWGWRMLNAQEPFANTRSVPAGAKFNKVAIFMTDGQNTASRGTPSAAPIGSTLAKNGGTPNHNEAFRSDADNTSKTLCEGMKSDGIEVYSISFKIADSTALSMVRDCATSQDKYFNASNSSLLYSAFDDIALSLLAPRLTQ